MSTPRQFRCWAEVDLDALRNNLGWIRHRLPAGVQVMTVVKADAYGHGLRQIAGLLMQSGTDVFGVANLAEAETIHLVGPGWPVVMLGTCLPHEVDRVIKLGVIPSVSTLAEARCFSQASRRAGKNVAVHVKVDTGMGRIGVPASQAAGLVAAIGRLPGLKVAGMFTHYAAAEDDRVFTAEQRRAFERVMKELGGKGRELVFHSSNSAAVLLDRAAAYQMVRPGLLVYGVAPAGSRRLPRGFLRHFRPALTWKCRVALVKDVEPGTTLSYGRTFKAERPMQVATIGAGYGDGFPRAGSNRARVLIRGRLCPVLGRVTMDQTLVDVTGLRGVKPGEEVVLIGRQGRGRITVDDLAGWCGTIPWEILTGISYRVPRVYRGGQAA